ncbi:MAG: hypothetical protein C4557_08375 [Anaerolineaceae bacterium]|jgi:hypothetical protein|nr:MAG: hypothetical protein C4557_08375 [Anaerolineaceae bacterium]
MPTAKILRVGRIANPTYFGCGLPRYELSGFIAKETDFDVVYRTGGDIQLLKRFLTAGLPVIIEKGFEGRDFDGLTMMHEREGARGKSAFVE